MRKRRLFSLSVCTGGGAEARWFCGTTDSTGGEIGWSEWSQLKSEGLGLKGAGKRSTGAV